MNWLTDWMKPQIHLRKYAQLVKSKVFWHQVVNVDEIKIFTMGAPSEKDHMCTQPKRKIENKAKSLPKEGKRLCLGIRVVLSCLSFKNPAKLLIANATYKNWRNRALLYIKTLQHHQTQHKRIFLDESAVAHRTKVTWELVAPYIW